MAFRRRPGWRGGLFFFLPFWQREGLGDPGQPRPAACGFSSAPCGLSRLCGASPLVSAPSPGSRASKPNTSAASWVSTRRVSGQDSPKGSARPRIEHCPFSSPPLLPFSWAVEGLGGIPRASDEPRGFKRCLTPPETPDLDLFKVKNRSAEQPWVAVSNHTRPWRPAQELEEQFWGGTWTGPAWAGPPCPTLLQRRRSAPCPQGSPNPWGFCSELPWGLLAPRKDFQPGPLVIGVCSPEGKRCSCVPRVPGGCAPCPASPCRSLLRCPSLSPPNKAFVQSLG